MMQSQNNGQQSTAIAQRQDTQLEGASLHTFDIRPPTLSLIQSVSAKGDTDGWFIRNDTDEEYEYLEVTAIIVQKNQTRWGEGEFSRDRKPLCFSPNGLNAAMTFADGTPTEFPGRECLNCEWFTEFPWRDRSSSGYCAPGYFAILMDVNTFECFIMRLNSTSAKLGKVFAARGIFRRKVLTLSSDKKVTERGTYYEMQAKVGRKLDEGEIEIADGYYNDLRHLRVTADDSEESDLASQTTEQSSQPASPPAARISDDRPQPRQSRDFLVNDDPTPVYGADVEPVETEAAPQSYNPW